MFTVGSTTIEWSNQLLSGKDYENVALGGTASLLWTSKVFLVFLVMLRENIWFVRDQPNYCTNELQALLTKVAESESQVFVWSRSRIPNNTRCQSRIFLSDPDSGNPIGSFCTSYSYVGKSC